MAKVKVITDPEVIKLMLEDTRRKILQLLRNREMTISQLSEILGKTPPNHLPPHRETQGSRAGRGQADGDEGQPRGEVLRKDG